MYICTCKSKTMQ